MRLAGEAGSLLKVEKEIEKAITAAQEKAGPVFAGINKPFWNEVEDRLVKALTAYADLAAAKSSSRRRMFAEDAAQGVAFVDVCRRRFDAVLMNPPFGDPSVPSRPYVDDAYPRGSHDIFLAFVDRGVEWLRAAGMLGAITNRTGFFLIDAKPWREQVIFGESHPTVVADLGYGIMEDAMVEAAAYCLRKSA